MAAKRKTKWLLALLLAALAYLGLVYFFVVRRASGDEARHADVIVVFGAAEYAGRPSQGYGQ